MPIDLSQVPLSLSFCTHYNGLLFSSFFKPLSIILGLEKGTDALSGFWKYYIKFLCMLCMKNYNQIHNYPMLHTGINNDALQYHVYLNV